MLNGAAYTQLGQSGAIEQLLIEARLVSATNFNVLLAGEPGVGKGMLAQCIHEHSSRRKRKMLSRNCAGVAQSRLETELFGHGGLLERADRGTLLLDDVGELGSHAQALLYRFLDTGDVRIISATNRDLLECDSKPFSADLYYRLNLAYLQIPALRERREDILFLMEQNLKIFSEQFRLKPCNLAPSAASALEAYSWPGNIRELREAAKLLALTQAGRVVAIDQLPETVLASRGAMPPIETPPLPSYVADAVAAACYDQITQNGESFWTVVYGPFLAGKLTRDTVRSVVTRGLRQTHNSYKALTSLFNLEPTDQRRFMSFLEQHNCHPRPQAVRASTDDAGRTRASHRRAV